ncbi:MAG: moderate conductance mechanosensitive channel [Actinomycetota bacterium]|jgi:small-conductance mechanosensitive channel|nr:moderate conductance mechanosensitive channel [Actinomycetota bacterium]
MTEDASRPVRPQLIKALGIFVLLVAGFVIARLGNPTSHIWGKRLEAFLGAALVLLAGIVIVRLVASAVRMAMEHHRGDQRGAPLGLIVSGIGYLALLLAVLSALRFKLDSLLLGGALTGVIIGIAAQQTLSNFFAGILLMIVRPFNVGDRVVLRSALGEYEGVVRDIDFFYVKLATRRGPLELPTASVLGSAIGPGARSQDPAPEPDGDDRSPGRNATSG